MITTMFIDGCYFILLQQFYPVNLKDVFKWRELICIIRNVGDSKGTQTESIKDGLLLEKV